MKKIIVFAACVILTTSAFAADKNSNLIVARADIKTVAPATAFSSAPRAKKASASKWSANEYSVERDGCCYTR